jgi:lysophospholipase L1-like esterase
MGTPLQPFARLTDLTTGNVVATTLDVFEGQQTIAMDAPQKGRLVFPLGDASGAATSSSTTFGASLLRAAGQDDGTPAVPMLLEYGTSGPTGDISLRMRVEQVTRELTSSGYVVTVEGDCLLSQYAGLPIGHALYPGVALQDALNAPAGTIVPTDPSAGFVGPTALIPYLAGMFQRVPGLASWPSAARSALHVVPAVDPPLNTNAVNIAARGVSTLKVLGDIVKRAAGDYLPGDSAPMGFRSHYFMRYRKGTAGTTTTTTTGGGPSTPPDWKTTALAQSGNTALWMMDEASGLTRADATGNGHDVTFAGTPTAGPSLTSGSARSTRISDSATYGTITNLTGFPTSGAFTIEVWVDVDASNNADEFAIAWGNATVGDGFGIALHSNRTQVWGWMSGHDLFATPSGGAISGHHCLLMDYDGTTQRVFLDNVLLGSQAVPTPSTSLTNGRIGMVQAGGGFHWLGSIGATRVVSRVLTATERSSAYAAGMGTVPNLNIGFIGDSITANTPSDGTQSPPQATCAALATSLGRPVAAINQGVSGSSTSDWLPSAGPGYANAKAAILAAGCPLVHIMLGTNDSRTDRRTTATTLHANLSTIIADLEASGLRVVVSYPAYVVPGSGGGLYDATSDTLLQSYEAQIDSLVGGSTYAGDKTAYAHFSANQSQLIDGLHPNAAGVAFYASAWAPAIQAALPASSGGSTTTTTTTAGDPGNDLIVGRVGGNPAGIALVGGASAPVGDEATTARIVDGATISSNNADACAQALFVGGKSNAGLPAGAQITGLALLNPIGTGGRTDYTTCLPIISYQVQNRTGGVLFFANDGTLRPLLDAGGPVYCLNVDNTNGVMYAGTSDGVLTRSTNVRVASPWTHVGELQGRVDRLQVVSNSAGTETAIWAQVTAKDKALSGIYHRNPASPTGMGGVGHDGWTPAILGEHIQSFAATDPSTYFVILNNQGNVWRHVLGSPNPMTVYALPTGVRAYRLDRVITAGDGTGGHTATDSIWASTSGDGQGAYILKETGTSWGAFYGANADGSLSNAATPGHALQINAAVGLGLTIEGQYTAVFVCTSSGIWWADNLNGTAWKRATGLDGLTDYGVSGVTAGQYQALQGALTTRVFAYNPTQLFYSNSSARFWRDLTKEELHWGPYFAALALGSSYADLPHNDVITIGPMALSPISNPPNTHIQVACLPTGWYWLRQLDDCLDWEYRLVNGSAVTEACMASSIADLGTSTSVSLVQSSNDLAKVGRRWLAENTVPVKTIKVLTTCTTQEAGILKVYPGDLVPVTLQDAIPEVTLDGTVVRTVVVAFSATPLYVTSITRTMDQSGGPLMRVELELSNVYRKEVASPDDLAAGLQDQLNSLKDFYR